MTDLTLRHAPANDAAPTSVFDVLKDVFGATPLGIVLAAFAGKR
jgi:hypothetical protein